MSAAAIGRIVHYKLGEQDAEQINRRREDYSRNRRRELVEGIETVGTGEQIHVGNAVKAGDVYPAMIVRTWGAAAPVQLQVFLDGNDTFWGTSRSPGEAEYQWMWPPRV